MTNRAPRSSRLARRGYTAVEVLLSITVLAIGATGVIAMQKAAVQGNTDARELDMANAIGNEWMERIKRDATLWTPSTTVTVPPANIGKAVLVNENITGQWFIPKARFVAAAPQNDVESPGFDTLGRDVTSLDYDGNGLHYCVNVRLTPLTTDQTMIRAEVRVYWPRMLTAKLDPKYCNSVPQAGLDLETDKYHFIYLVSAIRQNVQP
jgi:type IV pilus assembly protein PilV